MTAKKPRQLDVIQMQPWFEENRAGSCDAHFPSRSILKPLQSVKNTNGHQLADGRFQLVDCPGDIDTEFPTRPGRAEARLQSRSPAPQRMVSGDEMKETLH